MACQHSRPVRAVQAKAELNMDRRTALASTTAAIVAAGSVNAEALAEIDVSSKDWEVVRPSGPARLSTGFHVPHDVFAIEEQLASRAL